MLEFPKEQKHGSVAYHGYESDLPAVRGLADYSIRPFGCRRAPSAESAIMYLLETEISTSTVWSHQNRLQFNALKYMLGINFCLKFLSCPRIEPRSLVYRANASTDSASELS